MRPRPESASPEPGRWRAMAGAPWAERVVVASALGIGVVTRFTPSTPMWLDEALTVNIADGPLGEIADRLRADGHPPLFYWLLNAWMRAVGDSAASARALSGVLGLAAVALVWWIAHRLGGPRAGRAAAVVVAVSPFAIRYSSEVRMYQLVVVLVAAGWLLLDAALARPTAPRLAGLAVVVGLGLLTHYWVPFLVLTVAAVLAWQGRPGRAAGGAERRALGAMAAGGLAFAPWLPVFVDQVRHTGTPWAAASRPTRVVSESVTEFAGGLLPEAVLNGYLLVGLVLLGVAVGGRRSTVADPRVLGLVLVGTVALGAVVSWLADAAYAGRYASVIFPIFVVLAGLGVASLASARVRVGALAAVVLLGTAATGHAIVRTDRTQAGEIAEFLRAAAAPGDLVVVCPDQLGPALARLLPADGPEIVRYPDLGDPRFVDWRDYVGRFEAVDPATVAGELDARRPSATLWLVWNGGYRAVGEHCDALVAALGQRRPGGSVVLSADPGRHFENASVLRLPAPGS